MIEIAYNNFVCKLGWFSLQLPEKWVEYGFEEGIYEFIDVREGEGNLRVLPLRFEELDNEAALNYIEETYENALSKNARKNMISDMCCVSFKESVEMTELDIFYWFLQKNNFVFIFSFSSPIENGRAKEREPQLHEIESIIRSVKTME